MKQEKKQKDTELSIRSSMTECKFRQEQQRAEAAKKRAAKKVGPQAFNFFYKGLIFGAGATDLEADDAGLQFEAGSPISCKTSCNIPAKTGPGVQGF